MSSLDIVVPLRTKIVEAKVTRLMCPRNQLKNTGWVQTSLAKKPLQASIVLSCMKRLAIGSAFVKSQASDLRQLSLKNKV